MARDELSVLHGNKCILQLRGVRPFLSDKYDLTQHPNYKYTAEYEKKNTFDIEAFLNLKLKLKANDVYDVVEVEGSEETEVPGESEELKGSEPLENQGSRKETAA